MMIDDKLPPPKVSLGEAFRYWLKLGFISFGGPAGQIAMMHNELVDRRGWVSEQQFLRALNFCTLLPGPEAQQLATYIGWRLHGIRGGVVAGALFILPGALLLLLLSWMVATYGDVPLVQGIFYGIQPVVVAVVIEAVYRVGRRTLTHPILLAIAVAAFVALTLLRLPFPAIVLAAAAAGLLAQRVAPQIVKLAEPGASSVPSALPSARRNLTLVAVFGLLWALPYGLLLTWRGQDDVLVTIAQFFTQAAFVTFGGAYAVLSYVADVAVNGYGWLTTAQMIKGLALAESTPGPLIMVLQYVGYFGAYSNPGPFPPAVYGAIGALVSTYATFLPCFFFVFLGAPYIEALSHSVRLQAALTGVTAAVVGVILNLGVFFAGHVLFPRGMSLAGLDVLALAIAAIAFVALQRFKVPVYAAVLVGGIAGALLAQQR